MPRSRIATFFAIAACAFSYALSASDAAVRTATTHDKAHRPNIPMAAAPPAVRSFCRDRAVLHKFPVLCPTRWPHTPTSAVAKTAQILIAPSFYWGSFNDADGFRDADGGHLIIGGQKKRFSLAGSPGETWPRPSQPHPAQQLGLPRLLTEPKHGGGTYIVQRPAHIIRTSEVRTARALVLRADAYPTGGFMGGHVIVLWNSARHGYFVSLHYDGRRNGTTYTLAARIRAALTIARSMTLMPSK